MLKMKEKLYRSRSRVFGGVAAGLGNYLNLDPILVRIIFIVIALINGVGILLYIILWIIIPEEPWEVAFNMNSKTSSGDSPQDKSADQKSYDFSGLKPGSSSNGGKTMIGIILIGLGVIFLLDNLFPFFEFVEFFPIVLIVVGLALIFNSLKNKELL